MFQFPPFAPIPLFIREMVILADWVPPFGHYRVKAFLAARRYFSQPDTSFIASRYLGILRTPLIASSKTSLPLLSKKTLFFFYFLFAFQITSKIKLFDMVGLGRVERPTSCLSGKRSNHLSYRP